jgi:hypothetical protein
MEKPWVTRNFPKKRGEKKEKTKVKSGAVIIESEGFPLKGVNPVDDDVISGS